MKTHQRTALLGAAVIATLVGSALAAPPAFAAASSVLVAAPNGSGESCSESAPCALSVAQTQARAASAAGNAVDVTLRGGDYNLNAAMQFTAEDSGTEAAPVTYKAFGSESPVLTSAAQLAGWQDEGGGVVSAPTAGLDFRQLYVDGVRATPARYPNVGSNIQLQRSDKQAKTLTILTEQFNTFGDADLSQVDVVAQLQWGETFARLATASDGGTTPIGALTNLTLQQEESDILFQRPYPILADGSALHFENARAFLDTPGEFFVDRAAGRVYYMPRAGEAVDSAFNVPVLDSLIDIEGTAVAPVHDLRFEGLTFEYSGWNRPTHHGYLNAQGGLYNLSANMQNQQYSDRPPAAVQASYADRLQITRNTFTKIGATALDLDTAVHDSSATGNVISDVSGNGIMVGKFTNPDVEYHTPYNPSDINEVTARVVVSNNVITRTGQVYLGTAGINGGYIRESSIVHNDISDVPWAGITTGWGWTRQETAQRNNTISFNRISNVVNQLCDTAGIYHLSNDPGTVFEGNYIHDIVRTPTACGSAVSGFYFDEGTDNTIVRDNVLADTDGQVTFNAPGPNNVVTGTVAEGKGLIQAAGLEAGYRDLLNRVNLAAGKPTSSSSDYNPGFASSAAVDGDPGAGWSPTSGDSSAWWQVDLEASQSLAQVSLTTRQNDNQVETRRNFEIRASNDPEFANYTVLAKRDDKTIADAGTYTAAVKDRGQYRYLRVVKTDGSYFFIAEFSAQAAGGVVSSPAVPTFDQSTAWTLTNVNSGLLAEISGRSTDDGGALNQYTANGQTNQQWYLRPATGNLFSIVNVNSGKGLDSFASFRKGDGVYQWTLNGKSNQLWAIEPVADAYVIRNAQSGQVLDVGGNSTQAGARIGQWMNVTQKNQQWKIAPVAPATVTPSANAVANQAGWYKQPVDLSFTTVEGVSVQTRVLGTEAWSSTQPVKVTAEGTTKVEFRGVRGGSVAAGSTGQLEVKVDSVSPISSASCEPGSCAAVEGQVVAARIAATDATSGVASVEYSIDSGATWVPVTESGVSFSTVGAHVVQFRATDVAGNVEAPKSITLTVAAAQTVAKATITSADEPTPTGWYQQNVLVKLSAPKPDQKVQYRVNAGAWKSYSSSITVSANGTTKIDHRLLSGRDVVAGSEAQLQVKLDKVAPSASFGRSPVSGKGTPRNPISVTLAGSDTLSGLDKVEYRVNGGAWAAVTEPLVFAVEGDYVVSYRAVDAAGNLSATKSSTLVVVADPVTTVKVSAATAKPGAAVTLTLTGYKRWDDVAITFAGSPLATVLTDQNGAAKVTVKLPADAANGAVAIVATGTDGATSTVTVTVKK